jgi:hypothetical protein
LAASLGMDFSIKGFVYSSYGPVAMVSPSEECFNEAVEVLFNLAADAVS